MRVFLLPFVEHMEVKFDYNLKRRVMIQHADRPLDAEMDLRYTVVIEHCINCDTHGIHTRHDE